MGSENKEKWLLKLKDSVQNHSEQLPDNFWEDLKKDIPAPAPATGKGYRKIMVWAASAAAILLLALLLIVPGGREPDATEFIAQQVDEHSVDKKDAVQGNVIQDNVAPGVMVNGGQVHDDVAHEDVDKEDTGRDNEGVENVIVEGAGNEVVAPDNADVAVAVSTDAAVRLPAEVEEKKTDDSGNTDSARQEKVLQEQKQKEREELLRELEYLQKDDKREGRGILKNWLAFAGGNTGIPLPLGRDVYSDDLDRIDNDLVLGLPDGTGNPPDGEGSFPPTGPGNVGGFVNMDYQPVGNIIWLGANAPQVFREELSYKSCSYDHSAPVKLGISFAKEVVEGIFLETGISYQYLKSTMSTGKGTVQKLHYIGVPLRFSGRLVKAGSFSIYLAGGYLLEKCVYGVLEHDNEPDQRLHIKKLQHSLNAAVGLQLGVGGGASIYIEPGAYWYMGMENEYIAKEYGYIIRNKYSAEPNGYSFQGGLRFTF